MFRSTKNKLYRPILEVKVGLGEICWLQAKMHHDNPMWTKQAI